MQVRTGSRYKKCPSRLHADPTSHFPPTDANRIDRCFERCIPCELVASSKKGAAVAAALPSPTERVKMILTVADFGSLSEIYTHGIVRAHESGLVCRRQALRVL